MQQHTPHHSTSSSLDAAPTALPTLELPPVPFARAGAATGPVPAASAPATPHVEPAFAPFEELMPSGASIDEIIESMRFEPFVSLDEERPHTEFTTAVGERRARIERRTAERPTPDRRTFTSEHLAAPDSGPTDPRPLAPPATTAASMPLPINTIMPELPSHEPLQPARPYELPSRGVAGETIRSSRPSIATAPAAGTPFPTMLPVEAAAPLAVEPIAMPTEPAQAAPPQGIDSIFGTAQKPVGRLDAFTLPAPAQRMPEAGPAGPAFAPGAGLDRVAATAAATPAAWFGGQVQVDEAMLIWNAPGASAPLAPAVAAAIAPQHPQASTAPGTPAALATTTLAPAAPARPAAAATASRRSPLRLLAWIGVPAGAGIGIAVAIDRLLF